MGFNSGFKGLNHPKPPPLDAAFTTVPSVQAVCGCSGIGLHYETGD